MDTFRLFQEIEGGNIKICLGCGPLPTHPQHLKIIDDSWILVDKYIKDPKIKNWDATNLPVEDNSIEAIYCSHLLEHIPHVQVLEVLKHWNRKLKIGGELIINVPDMTWVAKRVIEYSQDKLLDGYFNQWEGEHGLQSIIYGSEVHEGEYHKSGYTKSSLEKLLSLVGFKGETESLVEAHDMGCLINHSIKICSV